MLDLTKEEQEIVDAYIRKQNSCWKGLKTSEDLDFDKLWVKKYVESELKKKK